MTNLILPHALRPEIRIFGGADADTAPADIIMPVQTHSCRVAEVTADDAAEIAAGRADAAMLYPQTDALITRCPDTFIGVRTADCVPVLLSAPDIGAVAAIHAGWRGTLADIVGATVERLVALGADPAMTEAYIAPCICAYCYEVSRDLAKQFEEAGLGSAVIRRIGNKPRIHLKEANCLRLLGAGIPEASITISPDCTRHTAGTNGAFRYYSYRRIPGETRRNISAIRLAAADAK